MNLPHNAPDSGRTQLSCARRYPGNPANPRERGFTLVELLSVVAIAALLAAVGIPSMARIIDSTRLTSYSNDFLSAIYLARSEAIKRNRPAVLCKSANGIACALTGGWEQGWIVFHDLNNNGTADEGEAIVHHSQALPQGFRLSGNLNVARYIAFTPAGRTRMVSGALQMGTLTLCKESGSAPAREIVINHIGRPRVNKLPESACG